MNESTTPGRAGRPRDPEIEEAILDATRSQLLDHGYAALSLTDIAAAAGTSRPAVYRRWRGKDELVHAALRDGYDKQRATLAPLELDEMSGRGGFESLICRLDPRRIDPRALSLFGGVLAESDRQPELLEAMSMYGVGPRVDDFRDGIRVLQEQEKLRAEIDVETLLRTCLGAYLSDVLVGETVSRFELASKVATLLWPLVAPAD
ncbi:TetR/AcrR family transcriptional regulator [Microbacterium sp. NPDC058389]|uniref:TetR/AcrR family transcriptional regulator n=1 Tax=Microbacterium sp. NPDC058389 TaxID=3346475 RepID=UPI0036468561